MAEGGGDEDAPKAVPRRQENVVEPRQEVSGEGRRFVAIVGRSGCGNGRRRIAERIVCTFCCAWNLSILMET